MFLLPSIIRVTGGLIVTFIFFATLVCMPPEPIIQLLLVPVQACIGPCQAVHLATGQTCQALLHVALVIEIRHVPPVFLVIIIVGICTVVAWCYTLCIGCGGSVVEIWPSLVGYFGPRTKSCLLWLFGPCCSDTNHPNQKYQQNNKNNSPGDPSSNVGKLRLLLTVFSCEGSCTLAVSCTKLVFQTFALVPTPPFTHVSAISRLSTAQVSWLALTPVRIVPGMEETNSILITKLHLSVSNLASVGTVTLGYGSLPLGAGVWGAGHALSLLLFWLVETLWTGGASIHCCIQVLTSKTYW